MTLFNPDDPFHKRRMVMCGNAAPRKAHWWELTDDEKNAEMDYHVAQNKVLAHRLERIKQ